MDDPLDLITIIHLLNGHSANLTHPLDKIEQAQAEYFHNIITDLKIYGLNVYFKDGERSNDNGDYEGVMILLRAKEFKYAEEGEVIKEPETEIPEVVLRNRYVFRKDWFAFLEHATGMTVEKYRELTSQNREIDFWGLSPDKPDDIETRDRIIQQQKDKEEEDLYHFKRIGEMYKEHPFWDEPQKPAHPARSVDNDGAAFKFMVEARIRGSKETELAGCPGRNTGGEYTHGRGLRLLASGATGTALAGVRG